MTRARQRPPVESGAGTGGVGTVGWGRASDMEYEADFVEGVMVKHDISHLRLAALRCVAFFAAAAAWPRPCPRCRRWRWFIVTVACFGEGEMMFLGLRAVSTAAYCSFSNLMHDL